MPNLPKIETKEVEVLVDKLDIKSDTLHTIIKEKILRLVSLPAEDFSSLKIIIEDGFLSVER